MSNEIKTKNQETKKIKLYQAPTLRVMGKLIEETKGDGGMYNDGETNDRSTAPSSVR